MYSTNSNYFKTHDRYLYQGSEMDKEVKGDGNSYTTTFRQLDPRLGRWMSLDPLFFVFEWQTPYCSMDNNPIFKTDYLGLSANESNSQNRQIRKHPIMRTYKLGRLQLTLRIPRNKWLIGGVSLKFRLLPKSNNRAIHQNEPEDANENRRKLKIDFTFDEININRFIPIVKYWDWDNADIYSVKIPYNQTTIHRTNQEYGNDKFKVKTMTHGILSLPNSWPSDDNPDLQGNRVYFSHGDRFWLLRPIESLFFKSPKDFGLHFGFTIRNGNISPIIMYINGTHKPNFIFDDYYTYGVATSKITIGIPIILRLKYLSNIKIYRQ
jgi:RHS repeat-associated protein